MVTRDLIRELIAEFLGTFMLVFVGTGAIIVNNISEGAIGHIGIALAFGFVVMTVIYVYGEISGAHINPAVTLGFWAARRFPGNYVIWYIVSQLGGAILASLTLKLLFPQHNNLGATFPSTSGLQSVVFEFILTWWLMAVILGVSVGAKEKGIVAGIVVGSVVTMAALVGGPISGASLNPARSLGPALISMNLDAIWIYLVAPSAGSLMAAATCRLVHQGPCCKS